MISDVKALKQEFEYLVDLCRANRHEVDNRFLDYQNKVDLEFQQHLKKREIFQNQLESMHKANKPLIYTISHRLTCQKQEDEVSKDDSYYASSNTLNVEEISTQDDYDSFEDESQEMAINHVNNFHIRKEIQRKIRYSRSHYQRAGTLLRIDGLYKDISRKTSFKATVDLNLMSEHFDAVTPTKI